MSDSNLFDKIISHAKEYGFVFPSSDIYGGLAAVYDYGQNGAFHIEGTTLFWHGRFNLSPTDQVYIKYLTLNS